MANVRSISSSTLFGRAGCGSGSRLAGVLIVFGVMGLQSATAQSPDLALRGHGGPIRSIAVLGDGAVVTGGFDAVGIEWDIPTGTARHVLRQHAGSVDALVALGDRCVISGGEDGRLAHWCRGPSPASMIDGQIGPITSLVVSADGRHLASGSREGRVRLWEFATAAGSAALQPTPIATIEHAAPISGVAFTPDGGAIVSASHDGEVRVTPIAEAASRTPLRRSLAAPLTGLASMRDGRFVLGGADGHLRILAPDLTPVFTIDLAAGPVTAMAFSPDGRTLAVAGVRSPVKLVDLVQRRLTLEIVVPGLPTWGLAFSKDGQELFTGGGDRALRRWNVATAAAVGEMIADASDPPEGRPPEDGARVFRACIACHTTRAGDGHRAGPTLHGIMGRRIATAPDYAYSDALKNMDIVWTPDTIARLFEVGPTIYTPGTRMPEQRITDPADRRALVEWLERMTRP
jgi:cytochrome c